jgi:RNAse (barnase) inhibitor barstar
MTREYCIDGTLTVSLEAFFDQFSRVVLTESWGRNLDAFNDVLRGGFGTPDEGFILRWKNSARSKELLGPVDFDLLIEIISVHGAGGAEAEDNVLLILE